MGPVEDISFYCLRNRHPCKRHIGSDCQFDDSGPTGETTEICGELLLSVSLRAKRCVRLWFVMLTRGLSPAEIAQGGTSRPINRNRLRSGNEAMLLLPVGARLSSWPSLLLGVTGRSAILERVIVISQRDLALRERYLNVVLGKLLLDFTVDVVNNTRLSKRM